MQLKSIIPIVYQQFLTPQLLNLNAVETKATCASCLRSKDKRFSYLYKENLKCCTFHPYLPNYAVGALLSDANGKGPAPPRRHFQARFSELLRYIFDSSPRPWDIGYRPISLRNLASPAGCGPFPIALAP